MIKENVRILLPILVEINRIGVYDSSIQGACYIFYLLSEIFNDRAGPTAVCKQVHIKFIAKRLVDQLIFQREIIKNIMLFAL